MREIKFRAFTAEGYMIGVGELTLFTDGSYLVNGEMPIAPNNLMQFTGLLDKNGKEIYEGDICKTYFGNHEIIAPMIFNTQKAQFGLDAEVDFESNSHVELTLPPKVIGNIYENPELLNK